MSQEIVSLGNCVALNIAIIFFKEILSLPVNSVAHIKHAYFVSNCDMIENSHMLLMHSDCFRTYMGNSTN